MSKLVKYSENSCRICLKNDKFKISIFCEYARKSNVQQRIKKYLQINTQSDDPYPNNICYQCLSRLEMVEKIINDAQIAQSNLKDSESYTQDSFFDDESLQDPVKNKSKNMIDENSDTEIGWRSRIDCKPENSKKKFKSNLEFDSDDEGKIINL